MRRKRSNDTRNLILFFCFLAAFHPNCTRCCPNGCTCRYAWETCPASSGCNSCNTKFNEAPTFDAWAAPMVASDASTYEAVGGTLAFVHSYVVVAMPNTDRVRVFSVRATDLEEDPLVVRTIGTVTFDPGSSPGRTIAEGDRARVVLRHAGAIATIDPSVLAIETTRVCNEPRSIAGTHVACASGDIYTNGSTRFVAPGLEEIAVVGGDVIASTNDRTYRLHEDGTLDSEARAGVVRAIGENVFVASSTLSLLGGPTIDLDHPASDVALMSDGTMAIAAEDAYVRDGARFLAIGSPGVARSVALADVEGDRTRRVLAVQTDHLLVFFSVPNGDALAIEPLD